MPHAGAGQVSLNTTGDTTPTSFLDVSRFPVSHDGSCDYSRDNIEFTDVAGTGYPGAGGLGTAKQITDSVRDGEGVLVIHGQDYDGNGTYSRARLEDGNERQEEGPARTPRTGPSCCLPVNGSDGVRGAEGGPAVRGYDQSGRGGGPDPRVRA